jgi:hypothetical protein
MAGFIKYSALLDAYDAGRYTISGFRKNPTITTTTSVWVDLSMTGGGPPPNYYASAPLIWNTLNQSTNGGLRHGGNVSPASKHLKSLMIASALVTTASPSTFILCDYLGYWPFVDMAGTVELTGSGLTRYTDGVGVKIMAVLVATQVGGCIFNLTYTNQAGLGGRTSKNVICNTAIINGAIVTTQPTPTATYQASPFIPLQSGDTGVKSVQYVNWITEDVGLLAIVLVKPIAQISLEPTTVSVYSPSEKDFALDAVGSLPVIQDDAYLNFICMPTATLASSVIYGMIETVWSA